MMSQEKVSNMGSVTSKIYSYSLLIMWETLKLWLCLLDLGSRIPSFVKVVLRHYFVGHCTTKWTTMVLVLVLLANMCVLLYPAYPRCCQSLMAVLMLPISPPGGPHNLSWGLRYVFSYIGELALVVAFSRTQQRTRTRTCWDNETELLTEQKDLGT